MTVLIGEPFGSFGRMMPVGHAAVYFDRICADGPLKVRMCRPGEQAGVAVARYHQIGEIDWVASPIMEFLYAVDRPDEVLTWTTPENQWALRQAYRERYLSKLVPDGHEYDVATNEWWETAGVAYNRKVWGYQLDTTVEQDERMVAFLNSDPNHHLYHLTRTNCANFVEMLVNLDFPGAVHHSIGADFGWMTPKQVAHCVWLYGEAHPDLHLKVIEVPQVPGSLVRSRPAWGAAEAGIKTIPYLLILSVIQPEVPITCAVMYYTHGRFPLGRAAVPVQPANFDRRMPLQMAGDPTPAPISGTGAMP